MTLPGQYNTDTSDMHAVHTAITSALDDARGHVDAATSPARVATIASFYENVLEFLHVHHQGEDEILYPLLEQRCLKDDVNLFRIDDQHKLLYEPMDGAREALAAWVSAPSSSSGAAVIAALSDVDEILRPHLKEEEDTVVPLAQKWISPEEWGSLAGHGMQAFRLDKPWLALGLVLDNVEPDKRAEMFTLMPPPVVQMWHEQWEPAYRQFMAEVTG